MDGTGLSHCDQEQLRAVVSVYGRTQRREPLLFSCVTGQIGHTMGASGMASLIKASLEIETGQMPAMFGLQTPLPIARKIGASQAANAPSAIRHTPATASAFGHDQFMR